MSKHNQEQSINYEQDTLEITPALSRNIETLSNKHNKINLVTLTCELQSKNNIKDLIKTYSNNIQHLIPHDSMTFKNKLMDIDVSLGTTARHSCSYNLTFSKQLLGKLTLTRNKLFSAHELTRFEDQISILYYPLNNVIFN